MAAWLNLLLFIGFIVWARVFFSFDWRNIDVDYRIAVKAGMVDVWIGGYLLFKTTIQKLDLIFRNLIK